MVPQGQLAHYTSAPASLSCQTPPLHFSQHPDAPHTQSAPHLTPHAAYVVCQSSVSSSCVQPNSSHHYNYARSAGREHVSTSDATMLCSWQGVSFSGGSSPPPPAYPPGFEPKHQGASFGAVNAATSNTYVHNAHLHPQPYPPEQLQSHDSYSNTHSHSHLPSHSHPHSFPHPQPEMHSHQNPHPDMHSHQHPHPHPHSHPHRHAHPHVQAHLHSKEPSQSDSRGLQYQHLPLQIQPPHPHQHPHQHPHGHPHPQSHQHQPSQMAYPAVQMACETSLPCPASQVPHSMMFHNFDGSGTVIGLPVMGTPVCLDSTHRAAPPPEIPQHQQAAQILKPKSFDVRQQSRKSPYNVTRDFQRGVPKYPRQPDGRKLQQNARQTCESDHSVFGRNYSSPKMCHSFVVTADKANNERLLESMCKTNQPQSKEIFNSKAALAKENCMPDSYCKGMEERSDGRPLRFSSCERLPTPACSEAQPNFLVKYEQDRLSPEASGEIAMEHKMTPADSKDPLRPYTKNKAGLTRWLEERKNKYPTPANMQRKAESRRKQEEMGELASKKPRNHLRYGKGGLSGSYHRRERPRIFKQTDSHRHCIGRTQLESTDTKCHVGHHGSGPVHWGNGSEIPSEIEDSGPIESPFQGQGSDLERGNQEQTLQTLPNNGDITKQTNKDEIGGACFAFMFRCKRRKQKGDRSTLGAERHKKLLFKLLNRDLEKEKSHVLQCCRFLVNNHFLQGLVPLDLKHFSWVESGKSIDTDSLNAKELDVPELLPIAGAKISINGLGAYNSSSCGLRAANSSIGSREKPTGKEEQMCFLEGIDRGQNLSTPNFANGDESCCKIDSVQEAHCSVVMPAQELGFSNKGNELAEDAHGPATLVEEFVPEAGVISAPALGRSGKNGRLIEEAPGSTMGLEEPGSNDKEQDLIANEVFTQSSSQSCHGVVEVDPCFVVISHNQPVIDGFIDCAESSLLLEPSCTRYDKAAISPWRHSDSFHPKSIGDGLIHRHYDCFKAPFLTSDVVPDPKHAPMLLSSSNSDSQGPGPSMWQQPNTDLYLPSHDMDTGEVGYGLCDGFLGDDDDILQYMNFDAFETDSGICYG